MEKPVPICPEDKENTPGASDFFLAPDSVLQDRYRIGRQLGKGGMGAVYQAVDLRLKTTVALKQVTSTNKQLRKQFEREAYLLAGLNHPALPRVSDYFTEEDRAFLVMEYVEGVDLAQIIMQQPGPFPRHQVIAWADQLLDALIYLHSRDRQIIHRDIKPHNLKLKPNDQIALLDFGLAKARSADSSSINSGTSVFGYTPRYAPLEQIQDLGTSPQSDIYALGATLYHLLTGLKPADALTRAAALVNSKPNPLRPANEIVDAVGPVLAAILDRAMAQNPIDRYANATEFRQALRRLGRVDDVAPTKQTAHDVGSVLGLVEKEEASPLADRPFSEPRPRSRAIAAGLMAVLGVAFSLFFAHYRWNWPRIDGLDTAYSASSAIAPADPQSPAYSQDVKARHREKSVVVALPERSERIDNKQRSPRTDPVKNSPIEDHKVIADRPRQQPAPSLQPIQKSIPPNPTVASAPEHDDYAEPAIEQTAPDKALQDASIVKMVLLGPHGNRVVKFADGTTRVFRPGDKIKRSGD
jgi:serine/threonine protein kinase